MTRTELTPGRLSTRRFLQTGAVLLGGVCAGRIRPVFAQPATASLIVDEVRTISHGDSYGGWPSITRRGNGQLVIVWSGGRESHVCPFGRVDMMRSDDDGLTWSWPRTLLDSAIDDRDAGVLETARGTLLVTTFTSLAYESILKKRAESLSAGKASDWPEDKVRRWLAAHHRLNDGQRERDLGQWMIRSTDGGVTWSRRYSSIVNSPHGPIALRDGRLLYAGKELWTGKRRVGVCQSTDDGVTWQWLAEIPTRSGDAAAAYHELHAVEAESGKLIVHVRNHNPKNDREILQSESTDGGRSWTTPRAIDVWGLPSHLLRLRDGRLMMTYGHRRQPLGIQARISDDEGQTWSDPTVIWGQGTSTDLGYPSTVELDDGRLITVWYEKLAGSPHAQLRQARLRRLP